MNIEIVWLAWDQRMVDAAWSTMSVRELYNYLINDSYRKKVDPRSMLFHNQQSYILGEVERLLKMGAIDIPIKRFLSDLFYKGEEEFPLEKGELFFDLSLISYFTSLRMADDYHMVEGFFDKLFKKMGIVGQNGIFSFFDVKDIDGLGKNLKEVKVQHIIEVAQSFEDRGKDPQTYIKLVQNYIEFFNYYKNNKLCPFYYNSQTDIKKWGNLVERQNSRSAEIVNMAYKKVKTVIKGASLDKASKDERRMTLISRLERRRKIENLIAGLADPDPLIRQKACEYLGSFGRVEDIGHLAGMLKDPESEVRQEACRALGEIGDRAAIKPLVEIMLKDDSVNVVTSAAQALANIGDSKALTALVEALKKGNYQLAVPIAFYPSLNKNAGAVKELLRASMDKNVNLRRQIAFILGELKNNSSVERLSENLNDEDREVKINSICSLGRIGSTKAVASLKRIAKETDDEDIKRHSLRALGGSPAAR